LVLEEQLDVF